MARTTRTKALDHTPVDPNVPLPYDPNPKNPSHVFRPRSYQLKPLIAWEQGRKRLVLVYPRRHGKDLTALAITQKAIKRRAGLYWHIYPTKVRGRLSMWDGKDFDGIPFRARFPKALVKAVNDTEMQVILTPLPGQYGYGEANAEGSTWQVMGADDPDSLSGPNPIGVVFSEYQLHDPRVWTKIIQPILAENGGWAIFDFTPEGENHAYALYEMAKRNPRWFCQLITVKDTKRDAPGEDGLPVVPEEDDPLHPDRESITEMRRNGTPEEEIQSQQYCSFKGSVRGAVFGDLVTRAEAEGRVTFVPYEVTLPVGTTWDIGRDTTAIWFYQEVGDGINFIEYIEGKGKDLSHWAHVLKEQREYRYGEHLFPHDMAVTEWTAVKSRVEIAEQDYRLSPLYVAEKAGLDDSIEATRRLFRRFRFDKERCKDGLDAARNYKFPWDEAKRAFGREPMHDWASHGASALRTFAGAYRGGRMREETELRPEDRMARMSYDPLVSLRDPRQERGRYARMGGR